MSAGVQKHFFAYAQSGGIRSVRDGEPNGFYAARRPVTFGPYPAGALITHYRAGFYSER